MQFSGWKMRKKKDRIELQPGNSELTWLC